MPGNTRDAVPDPNCDNAQITTASTDHDAKTSRRRREAAQGLVWQEE